MYHLLKGLHEYLTRKDEYSVVIIGLDNAGKTTFLERIKTIYNAIPGMVPDKIGPTIGQNIGRINLPSTTMHFFDLGGQRDIRSIWEKYYDECHAVVFVLDAVDQGRLSECWEVFDGVLNSPRLLNLPLLLLANKQDSPNSLSVAEIRESFDAWTRATRATRISSNPSSPNVPDHIVKGKGKGRAVDMRVDLDTEVTDGNPLGSSGNQDSSPAPNSSHTRNDSDSETLEQERKRAWNVAYGNGGFDEGAKAERVASLDVLGISALSGAGVKEAVDWLYIRVQSARPIERY